MPKTAPATETEASAAQAAAAPAAAPSVGTPVDVAPWSAPPHGGSFVRDPITGALSCVVKTEDPTPEQRAERRRQVQDEAAKPTTQE